MNKFKLSLNTLVSTHNKKDNENKHLEALRAFFIKKDFLAPSGINTNLNDIKKTAERILKYRNYDNREGSDDLDAVCHNLRVLRISEGL